MDTIIGGGLLSYFKDQFKHEILAGISTLSDSVLEKWVDAIEATVKNQCIGVQALHGMGTSAEDILRDNVWMLYHPCVTTKWRDEETANRFQEFVRRIQGQEQAKARKSQHAGAKRRRELLERACTDFRDEVPPWQLVAVFVRQVIGEVHNYGHICVPFGLGPRHKARP